MDYSFIHAADIHLDSPLRGLEKYDGAPVDRIRNATREALKNLVDLSIKEKVSFIVISGDLYDGDWKDYNTGLFFASQMSRLQKENIPVYVIRGNHDAQSLITKELALPENVIEFPVDKPSTVTIEHLNTAIHGRGFSTRAVTDNLAASYPESKDGYFNIGLLHTSATGREGHENYAPCQLNDLLKKQYDYWALGHIHQRELLHAQEPVVLFPGNIQGRHIRETGDKGCTLVHVKNNQVQEMEHRSLDVVRWCLCSADVSGTESFDDVIEIVRTNLQEIQDEHNGRFLAVRVVLTGTTNVHQEMIVNREHVMNNIRSVALDTGFGDVWVEKVKIDTKRIVDIEELKQQHSPISSILGYLDHIAEDQEALKELLNELNDIQKVLPQELKTGKDGLDFATTELITDRLDDIEDLILHHLTKRAEVQSS
ncbi:metallophosphoesterase family protein [Alteribacter keqinensis]|uniref:DNA repair exonuclease n=1 Tax=Alteribacter keqinensis TaxID=2483800 RepID=A0A3M7TWU3_9BACI|nr:DNA repair exonuclease [Alteribacter keqinensis]RNA69362.1 DNA repair exonuclease [Alteribacter keqinensis]